MRVQTQSVTGVAASPPLLLDTNASGQYPSVFLQMGAGCTASVQATADDVMDPTVSPVWVAVPVAALTGATTSVAAGLGLFARAVRLNQTAGAALSRIKVVSAGLR